MRTLSWQARRAWVGLGLLLSASSLTAAPFSGDACATAHPLATEACLEVLRDGGNAFDAAVAASAALAVVEPVGSGFGGGGFWLLYRAADQREVFLDGRETAPGAAHERMFQDAEGRPVAARSREGALSAGIPGEPAALDHLAQHYGRLPLSRSLQPALRYAREGFAVDVKLAHNLQGAWERLSAPARAIFGRDGQPLVAGEVLRQADLAQLLQRFAEEGSAGFYRGPLARRLVEGVRAAGGIWREEDLRHYTVVEREPLITWFRGYRIVTAPPPSAGGLALAQIFQQLEALGWRHDAGLQSRHLLIESMRRAYRDRAAFLGDPDFVRIPLVRLSARSHALKLAASIDPDRATPSEALASALQEGTNTTHLSVVDREGNRVAATLSINLPFGSGFMVPGTGLLLNNEMDDFSSAPGTANAYGLVGSWPNRVQPGKRPLSSMTPTFVEGPRGLLVLGTPGGSRIITMVALGILGWVEGLPLPQVAGLPRYHHQYLPDVVQFESDAFDVPTREGLRALGHTLYMLPPNSLNLRPGTYGNMQLVSWDAQAGRLNAAADPRAVGEGRVQHR